MINLRCDCERGGNCSKVSVCTLTNMHEEYDALLDQITESVDRMDAIIRNDLYKHRIRNVLAEIDECKSLLSQRP